MQGQKHVLVVDNDIARRDQIATVLSFVGEHFYVCPEDDIEQYFKETDNILTVVLCGKVS
ncbi:MAG: sigma-54 specific flagellar transcriptional regulator A, partial [Flavobacteriales bacterium]